MEFIYNKIKDRQKKKSKPKINKIINAAKEKKFTHCIQGKLNNYNGLFLIRNNEGQKEIE